MSIEFPGFHHLTAVSAQIRENRRFYTGTLGLRMVKRSVNQDDVSAYHLFYADGAGTPGTDLTFFDWDVPRERRGNHSVSRTGLRVRDEASLHWWQAHLSEHGVRTAGISELDGGPQLAFEDPEGQRLVLVLDAGQGPEPVSWANSPVPAEQQIRGLGPVTISVPELAGTDAVLRLVCNMQPLRQYPHPDHPSQLVHVYGMGSAGPHAELHVAVLPDLPAARPGAGGVHHVAFRCPDAEYDAWSERLQEFRIPNSGKVDRFWFRSLYFREPGGVLFEIATDGPGFAVDEPLDSLGEELILPPFLEPRRAQIEAGLKPID